MVGRLLAVVVKPDLVLWANSQQHSGAKAKDSGMAKVKSVLSAKGVTVDSFVQADGSGLSRWNLVSLQAMAETFVVMKDAADYRYFPDPDLTTD